MPQNEILTLQFGHYANFVGAHWWNTQELSFSYDPDSPSDTNNDILFREGRTLSGATTFTPRLLLVDLKGSLKSLKEGGDLYDLATPDDNPNEHSVEVVRGDPEPKNRFLDDVGKNAACSNDDKVYDLDGEVRVWSDFLYTRYHPRSVNVVKEYQHENAETPFDLYPAGEALWKLDYYSEDFCDKIRNYVEECDNFQGFHVISDSTNAFSGFNSSCIEHLRDEYENKSLLGFPVIPFLNSGQNCDGLINLVLSYDSWAQNGSLFIPLSVQSTFKNSTFRVFEDLVYKPDNLYHSAAILSSFLDTFSLNYRLKTCGHTLHDFCSDFGVSGRKCAAPSLKLPVSLKTDEYFIDYLDNSPQLFTGLSPGCEISSDGNLQTVSLRGIPESRLKRPPNSAGDQLKMAAYNRCGSVADMLDFYLSCTGHGSKSHVTVSGEKMCVKTPFPGIFTRLDRNEGAAVLAGVHSGEFMTGMFDSLLVEVEGAGVKRGLKKFVAGGLEGDEFRETVHRMLDLRDCYKNEGFL